MKFGLMVTLLLSTVLLLDGRAFAEETLRDQLEAWWNQTQAGRSAARTTCVRSETGCTRHKIVRSRRDREAATAALEGQVGRVRRASSGSDALPERDVGLSSEMSVSQAAKPRHVAKRGRRVVNARAEAGGGVSDRDIGPRRDRPGRYFLHGPRF